MPFVAIYTNKVPDSFENDLKESGKFPTKNFGKKSSHLIYSSPFESSPLKYPIVWKFVGASILY
jgi:hypothetical protein